jgi:hypothetical protein
MTIKLILAEWVRCGTANIEMAQNENAALDLEERACQARARIEKLQLIASPPRELHPK